MAHRNTPTRVISRPRLAALCGIFAAMGAARIITTPHDPGGWLVVAFTLIIWAAVLKLDDPQ